MILLNKSKVINIRWARQIDEILQITSENYTNGIVLANKESIKDLYRKNAVKDIDLTKLKKVYYDPACKFPRFKLSEFTKIRRSTKPETADAIIITIPEFDSSSYGSYIVFHSPSTDEHYIIKEGDIDSARVRTGLAKSMVVVKDIINYLVGKGELPADLVRVYTGHFIYLSAELRKSMKNILSSGQKPFIIDEDLDKAVSATMDGVTDEDLSSIKEFLSSSDPATTELGMKLLLNYNVRERGCTVGLMILRYNRQILATKAVNSVGFKNLLDALDLSKNDLNYFNENNLPYYLKKLYAVTTDENDKLNARQTVIDILQERLVATFNTYSDITSMLNIKGEINLS